MRKSSLRAPDKSRDYFSSDTIAAITTGVGGAIAVLRISGRHSFKILEALSKDSSLSEPRKLVRAPLKNPKNSVLLDDALSVRFVAPESFTGEDVVELHVHGGSCVPLQVLEAVLSAGARQALPGEFSFRAVKNGKMTLSQSQAVADLIGSTNGDAASLALEKISGSQNLLMENLAKTLRKVSVLGEIGIDFADQDIEEVGLPSLKKLVLQSLQPWKNSKPVTRGE